MEVHNVMSSKSACQLVVEQGGDNLSVLAGEVQFDGTALSLPDDELYVFETNAEEVSLMGYVVRDAQDPTRCRLFVDAVAHDGVDAPLTAKEAGFEFLFYLFLIQVPAGLGLDQASTFQVFQTQQVVQELGDAS